MKACFALLALGLVACSAATPDDTDTASADLVSVRQLGDLSASELRSATAARFHAAFGALETAHPDVRELTPSNLRAFVETEEHTGGAIFRHVDDEVEDTVKSLFRWTESTKLTVAEVPARFNAWLDTQIPGALLASGKVACDQTQARIVGRSCALAEREKAIASAKPARGVDLPDLAKAWQAADYHGLRFHAPVVVEGNASVSEIKSLAGVSPSCRQRGWGDEAVDAFIAQYPELARFEAGLKGNGIQKRWYWACGSDSWGEDGFAILDEHDQLWSFGTYSSE